MGHGHRTLRGRLLVGIHSVLFTPIVLRGETLITNDQMTKKVSATND